MLLPQPEICPEWMYDIMLQCWKFEPQERTTFTELLKALEKECALLGESSENGNLSTDYDTPKNRNSGKCLYLVQESKNFQSEVILKPRQHLLVQSQQNNVRNLTPTSTTSLPINSSKYTV